MDWGKDFGVIVYYEILKTGCMSFKSDKDFIIKQEKQNTFWKDKHLSVVLNDVTISDQVKPITWLNINK